MNVFFEKMTENLNEIIEVYQKFGIENLSPEDLERYRKLKTIEIILLFDFKPGNVCPGHLHFHNCGALIG